MSSVNLPRDDVGIRSLKTGNAEPAQPRTVEQVQPYGNVQPSRVEPQKIPARDRRRGERRRDAKNVMLDTRTGRDRRKNAQPEQRTGIDVYG